MPVFDIIHRKNLSMGLLGLLYMYEYIEIMLK